MANLIYEKYLAYNTTGSVNKLNIHLQGVSLVEVISYSTSHFVYSYCKKTQLNRLEMK